MSDKIEQPEFTRRGILGGILGTLSIQHLPLSATGAPSVATSVKANSSTLYQYLRYALLAEANLDKNYSYLQFLVANEEQRGILGLSEPEISAQIAGDIVSKNLSCDLSGWPAIGKNLLEERPSAQAIADFLASPECQELLSTSSLPPNWSYKVAGELFKDASLSEAELTHLINLEIESAENFVAGVQELAAQQPGITKQIKQLLDEQKKSAGEPPTQSLPGYDMAWAHKTAGPWLPTNRDGSPLTDEEQKVLGIGLHTPTGRVSGCENYRTITSRDEQLRAHYENRAKR